MNFFLLFFCFMRAIWAQKLYAADNFLFGIVVRLDDVDKQTKSVYFSILKSFCCWGECDGCISCYMPRSHRGRFPKKNRTHEKKIYIYIYIKRSRKNTRYFVLFALLLLFQLSFSCFHDKREPFVAHNLKIKGVADHFPPKFGQSTQDQPEEFVSPHSIHL